MSAHVQMGSTIGETRSIGDDSSRKSHYCPHLYRDSLSYGLYAIENARRRSGFNQHTIGIYSDGVSL